MLELQISLPFLFLHPDDLHMGITAGANLSYTFVCSYSDFEWLVFVRFIVA